MSKSVLDKYKGSDNMGTWAEWSQNDGGRKSNFPSDVLEFIHEINRQKFDELKEQHPSSPASYDPNHTYGFKIAFYMFMEDWERDYTEDYFEVNYFYQVLYPTSM